MSSVLRRGVVAGALPVLALGAFSVQPLAAQETASSVIEEVTVTAQRVEESVQDVPIAVTALTSDLLEDRQVINPSDLQLNAPNVSFTATNFGGSSFGIRGIGNLVIGRTGESGVSTHLNEISVVTNLNALEFFDMQRVEMLRGPQGTLYGRNATGGAINMVTAPAVAGQLEGFLDVESGDYAHRRFKGAVNLPLGERFALRLAGYSLSRDGYITNLAYGQTDSEGRTLPGIDDAIDGRDVVALRGTLSWEISDRASAWLMFSHFEEDDDRARITNQVCVRNSLPTTGCLPDEFGFQQPHLGATTAGIFAGSLGVLPFGVDGADSSLYHYPRPVIDSFREIHTDFDPVFQNDEQLIAFGFNYEFDNLDLSLLAADRSGEYVSQQDYAMDVGATLSATPFNPAGLWPASRPAGGAGEEWVSTTCNLTDGTSGVLGGCVLPIQQSRAFSYDQLDDATDYWTAEVRLRSTFDGAFNFLVGASQYERASHGGYYVLANTLDMVTAYGSPALQAPPLYPGFFLNSNNPDNGAVQEGQALFGEVYFDATDRIKFTAGLRFNNDNKSTSSTSVLFNSADANTALGGLLGPSPIWLRSGLLGDLIGLAGGATSISEASTRLLEFWGAEGVYAANAGTAAGVIAAIGAAPVLGQQVATGQLPVAALPAVMTSLGIPPLFQGTVLALLSGNPGAIAADPGLAAGSAALHAIADAVGPVPGFGETRYVTGSPTEASWRNVSGRLGFDYQLSNDTMIYAFYSRGFKPGGFNPAIPPAFQATSAFTFDSEEVGSMEFGAKSVLADGRLLVNGAVFFYDYTGLQVTRIRNNSSINDNIDANLMGLELEGIFRPEALPGLSVDFAYGWLSTEVDGSMSLDPLNKTGGDPNYILLNNIDPGSRTAVNFVAREAQITDELVNLALASGGALDIRNGGTVQSVSYAPNSAGVSIPAYFSQTFLDGAGVETLEGVPVSLDGNQLPNAPEHTFRIGVAHTWNTAGGGVLTARWDWYWQSDSYAREFNARGDEIDSWSQHNATAIYERNNFTAKLWVRNLQDDENVTGKYVTSDTSGFFRNYFVTEPRIYGLSVRVDFGAD